MKISRLLALTAAVRRCGKGIFGAAMLVAVLGCNTAAAAPSAPSDMQLTVALTPNVPSPRDAGFMGSLLSNRPADLRSVQLENQQQAITLTDLDESQTVAVVATPLLPEESSETHLSPTGIGSLYWAGRHLTQAWRVLLPMQSGDGSGAFANVRTSCVVFPDPPNDPAPC